MIDIKSTSNERGSYDLLEKELSTKFIVHALRLFSDYMDKNYIIITRNCDALLFNKFIYLIYIEVRLLQALSHCT